MVGRDTDRAARSFRGPAVQLRISLRKLEYASRRPTDMLIAIIAVLS